MATEVDNGDKASGGGDSSRLAPRESTEAYRVREDGSIAPKDRLVKFCDLRCVVDMGDLNDGIQPETIELKFGRVVETVTVVGTPYEYWGLPSKGTEKRSKSFKKKVKKQCQYFLDSDLNWMVEHEELVKPYFEEVATMGSCRFTPDGIRLFHSEGVSWGKYIDTVKEAIALESSDEAWEKYLVEAFGSTNLGPRGAPSAWRRPSPTETVAYRVRSDGTISPKDRLIELCELSSLIEFENTGLSIAAERSLDRHPARQTSNRYWGISPRGGRSEADGVAWEFFRDLDLEWVANHFELVSKHFDEVSEMGYGATVFTIRQQCHSI